MTALHRLYGTGYGKENEKVYRNKLKARIVKEFEESLKFLKIDCKTPEVVVSSTRRESTSIVKSKESVLKQAAEYLRDDILDYASKVDQSIWPPTYDSLQKSERVFPSTLNEFLRCVLKTRDHACSDSIKWLVNSYGLDLIHGVTRGKVITFKYFLIGIGLHNITGLKTPAKILSNLNHSVDYNFVCETETAEAKKAQSFFLNDGTLQPLEPVTPEAVVLTYWWADNFNQKLESLTGHGVIDSTHIVEFSK